jgi:hypothetical protein
VRAASLLLDSICYDRDNQKFWTTYTLNGGSATLNQSFPKLRRRTYS